MERLEKPGISALSLQDPQIPARVFRGAENVNADTVIACKQKNVTHHFLDTPDNGDAE